MTDTATWVSFTNDELTALCSILAKHHDAAPLIDRINNYSGPDAKDQDYRDAAEELDFVRAGECEIDDHAVVSASDEGAYVMAWVWVEREKEVCGQCEGTGFTNSASNLEHEVCPVCDGEGVI